ncbi:MAG: hypothetical protein JXR97_00505 [Planctomycetes bacterium]|nr:hypothetical protein [Planctomycetota bacterium]
MQKRLFAIILAAFLAVSSLSAAKAGDSAAKKNVELTGARLFEKLARQLNSIFLIERVEAIKGLSDQTDQGLIERYEVVKKISDIAKDENKFAVERVESLKGLLSLYIRGFASVDILNMLENIISDSKTNIMVKIQALGLLGHMGDEEGLKSLEAFKTLEKLWEKGGKSTSREPIKVLVAMIEAIGGFVHVERTPDLLLRALRSSKVKSIRVGALRGMQNYLLATGSTNNDMMSAAATIFMARSSSDERIEAVRVMELSVINGATPPKGAINDKLVELLKTGGDIEVQAAVRLLVRTNDTKIHEALLDVAWPKKERNLDFETYKLINNSLVEIIRQLKEKPNTSSSKEMADKIAMHYFKLLDPSKNIPVVLKSSAIYSLGAWPIEFDRTKNTQILIKLLEVEKDPELSELIEESLSYLTFKTFPRITSETGTKIPDIARWKAFFTKIEPFLAPKKSPGEFDEDKEEAK